MQIRITNGHCACGDYKSKRLKARAACRKSGSSPDSSLGVAHLLQYEVLEEGGEAEIGYLLKDMLGYSADYIRVEQVDDLD